MDLGLEKIQPHLEKLAKLPKPYRMAMLPGIAAIVIGLYVYFLYQPAHQQLLRFEDEHMTLQRKLNEVRSVAANADAFEEEIAGLEKKLKVALRQLPNSKELPVLLTDISSLGKNAGLDFKAFRPQAEIQRDFYAEVPIDIEFTGMFHDVALFFDEVARLPRIVNVSELRVGIAHETMDRTLLAVVGQARTFRFLEDAADAGGAPTATKAVGKRSGRRGH